MALDIYALLILDQAKRHLQLADSDLQVSFLDVYHDGGNSATACTISVDADQETLNIIITGGGDAGTTNIDLTAAATDTLAELIVAILAISDSLVVRRLHRSGATSVDLAVLASMSIYGSANRLTLLGTNNEDLERMIDTVSAWVETALGRKILARDHVEWYTLNGESSFTLQQFPVIKITRLGVGTRDAMRIWFDDSNASSRATMRYDGTNVILQSVASGSTTTTELAIVTYTTIATMAAAIAAVSGWYTDVLTDMDNFPTADLRRHAAYQVSGTSFHALVPDERVNTWDYEPDSGLVYLDGGVHGIRQVFVAYNAGYSTVPADMAALVGEVFADSWYRLGQDETLRSEKLGDYAYTRAIQPTSDWMAKLASWRGYQQHSAEAVG